MKITLKQLKDWNACSEGIAWFEKQKDSEMETVLRKLVRQRHFNWANWYVTKCMTKPQTVTYAVFAAEQCIGLFEKKYPNDDRPRKAIEAAKRWLIDPSESNRFAARAAWVADAARATRETTWSAADRAAWDKAAWAAAWAAWDAAGAVGDAAWAADRAADAAWASGTAAMKLIDEAIRILGGE